MSGSFWKFSNGFASISNISSLLENESTNYDNGDFFYPNPKRTLKNLLEENDLHQELMSNNSVLLNFLRLEEVLGLLVQLVINQGNFDDGITDDLNQLKIGDEEEKNPNDRRNSGTEQHRTEVLGPHSDSTASEDKESINLPGSDISDESENEEGLGLIGEDEKNEYDSGETEEERANRYLTLAAEILSADVWSLTDALMDSVVNLNKLWSILDLQVPLSINMSTFFMKIMEHLLDMKCDEMINYLIENQQNLVEKFINHMSNPPLMDFLLKLISTDKPDNSTGIIDFLQQQNLISLLIDALDIPITDINSEEYQLCLIRQSSAADFLKALITISANSATDSSTIGPNELTRELVSYEQMDKLCNIMLKGGYALANGVGIIIEIIRKNNCDYDVLPVLYITVESHPPTGRDPIYLGHLLKVFGSRIDKFNSLLLRENNPESNPRMLTPFGSIEPLGFERFKICELIAELLHCSNMALLNDNNGFDIVKARDSVRAKMKEYDPISFKYNEVIVLPPDSNRDLQSIELEDCRETEYANRSKTSDENMEDDQFANDTIDSFNSNFQNGNESVMQNQSSVQEDEPHANTNLSEEQIRSNPVIGDYLKISLKDTQIITNIITMFFKFPWNNFLHNVVFDIVQQVLNGSMEIGFNKYLAIDLFENGDITNRIINGQELCVEYEKSNNGLRLGYMGHLTLIAEEVVKFIQLYPINSISPSIDEKIQHESWDSYVNNVLYDTREKYNAILGGGDEDDDEVSNTFDETSDESDNNFRSDIVIDQNDDGTAEDTYNNSTEEVQDDFDDFERNQDIASALKSNSSDESSEEDDDHFTNYMSQQLTNTASTEIVSSLHSSEKDNDQHLLTHDNSMRTPINNGYDYDDGYIDPNDDGLSYKKANSVYNADGSLLKISDNEANLSSEDSSSSSDSDDEIIDSNNHSKDTISNKNMLTREISKS